MSVLVHGAYIEQNVNKVISLGHLCGCSNQAPSLQTSLCERKLEWTRLTSSNAADFQMAVSCSVSSLDWTGL